MLTFIIFYALATVVSAFFFRASCRWVGEKHDIVTNFALSLIWWAWWPVVGMVLLLDKLHPNA